ncbi:MAG: hypothetical protein AMJ75_09460 [Phycisphaerae bacterium SM1_79]|nr:MAG: hypothetical protein AMJ75_09460 [Phycisphaerae bacterium SM1_79]
MRRVGAFTLVEILVVVVLLGILAAIVIPAVGSSGASARQSVLAQNLKLLRRFALIYKGQHLEVGPGYPNGDTTQAPTEQAFVDQATTSSNANGQTAAVGTPGFNRGPYMANIPANPVNGKDTIQMLGDGDDFPADGDDTHGWIYKAATSQVRADSAGTGNDGKRYYDY